MSANRLLLEPGYDCIVEPQSGLHAAIPYSQYGNDATKPIT